ncbi:DUF6377 domain-containing protein [Flammeovirga sp. SubArs3]|uniref:DUF6377 domain-containing protein n=1 Tax=Flammeovirga sp. SubArs3 TaxID=2995316 RepID=UPI00248CE13A|nr:DUF6377 domain-containing protein [Flammeovirga sp. SubArs3]
MDRFKYIITLVFFSIPILCWSNDELEDLFLQLDDIIQQIPCLDQKKEEKIKSLKEALALNENSLKEKYFLAEELFLAYEFYKFKEAIHYAFLQRKLARELNDQDLINRSNLNLSILLINSGSYEEPATIMQKIDRKSLNDDRWKQYYETQKTLYNQLFAYTPTIELKEVYLKKYLSYCDTLLNLVSENSDSYLDIKETFALDKRNLLDARKISSLRLSRTSIGERVYSKAAYMRSLTYELEHDDINQKKYLILSAISDIKGNIKDNASIASLALKLYNENEIELAYKYIHVANEDALFFGSKLRAIQLGNVMPLISKSYEAQLQEKNNILQLYTILISGLIIIALAAVFFSLQQLKKSRVAAKELESTNHELGDAVENLSKANSQLRQLSIDLKNTSHIKEVYLGEFLKICSDYIDKLEHQNIYAQKMLVGRKYSKFLEELKNQDVRKTEMKDFYQNFDQTFLSIYPNFIEQINDLIDESAPVVVKQKSLLNTELRVFAFIRLGISDSHKIAKLLGTSVTTIYNYRVKLRNKAIGERDLFEEQVMEIGNSED